MMELANYRVRNFRAIIPSPPCCSEWINVMAGTQGFSFRLLYQWGFTSSIFSLRSPSVKHSPCRTHASNGIQSQGNTAYFDVLAFTHIHRNKLTNWGGWQHRRRCVSGVQPGDLYMADLFPTLSVRGWHLPSNFTLSSHAAGAGGGRWWSECCCPLQHTHTHIIWSWPDCGFTQSDLFCCQKPRSVCASTFPLFHPNGWCLAGESAQLFSGLAYFSTEWWLCYYIICPHISQVLRTFHHPVN